MAREYLQNIKSENRLSKIRLIKDTDRVIGGQPSDNEDEFTSNTPFLDLACSIQYSLNEISRVDKKPTLKVWDSFGDSKTEPGSQRTINEVNKSAKNAQTAANLANDKANEAKTAASTADSKAVAAQTAADNAQKTADSTALELKKKRDITDNSFKSGIRINADNANYASINFTNDRVSSSELGYLWAIEHSALSKALEIKARKKDYISGDQTNYVFDTDFIGSRYIATKNDIRDVPASELFFFDTKIVPYGYLELAGQDVNQKIHPKVYAEFGSRLPNRRDRYFRSANGSRSGAAGTLQNDAMRNITGRLTSRPSDASTANGSITNAIGAFILENNVGGNTRPISLLGSSSDLPADYVNFDASKGGLPIAEEIRPISVSVLVCIKAQ